MKKTIIVPLLLFTLSTYSSYAQSETKKTETFHVNGNCGMCKKTIEGSIKKKEGVFSEQWDQKTKMLTVVYDPTKTTLTDIKNTVAASGYDTDEVKASDKAYNGLDACCQYTREGK